ncbi:unnamed protein product [Microthlaspi erraticum]|uniref:PPM-type phosphatase domain-containing protein n=1 Tax=Microthlaspi erraticum TaxID=1685480 RepID=A0A6D2K7T1_9BRAS|nr:unnamed protein product [Microthlaspi erraticum]CAA7049006.1 unnamed protein product [Microthlaspi erraticum]
MEHITAKLGGSDQAKVLHDTLPKKRNELYCHGHDFRKSDSFWFLNTEGNKSGIYNLSKDHKPDLEVEKERILKAGGFIHGGRINGSLNLTRAFGDMELKQKKVLPAEKQMVTADPDINTHTICFTDLTTMVPFVDGGSNIAAQKFHVSVSSKISLPLLTETTISLTSLVSSAWSALTTSNQLPLVKLQGCLYGYKDTASESYESRCQRRSLSGIEENTISEYKNVKEKKFIDKTVDAAAWPTQFTIPTTTTFPSLKVKLAFSLTPTWYKLVKLCHSEMYPNPGVNPLERRGYLYGSVMALLMGIVGVMRLTNNMPRRLTEAVVKKMTDLDEKCRSMDAQAKIYLEREKILDAALRRVDQLELQLSETKKALDGTMTRQHEIMAYIEKKKKRKNSYCSSCIQWKNADMETMKLLQETIFFHT